MFSALFFFAFFQIQVLADDPAALTRALNESQAQKLWTEDHWSRLLHIKRNFLGTKISQADAAAFFVAPDGKSDPRAEMEATLRGFFSSQVRKFDGTRIPDQTVRCQFPARWNYLAEKLKLTDADLPPQNCKAFEEWKGKIAAKSATLVFSSYYLNNPSSAFGHSLIRLNKSSLSEESERAQLLDYGINYAATATTSNPALYALYGLAGIFRGEFASIPFYYKVREYSDFESRDLWEYDLDLTAREVEALVDHFWELGSTYFDYYYLRENCSYHMLTALEAAAPRLSLTDRLPFWIIPGDTIRVVAQTPGLVKQIHYRPSVRTQFFARVKGLQSPQEHKTLKMLVERKLALPPDTLAPEAQARVLDAAVDAIDYRHSKALVKKEPEPSQWKQSLLIARSRLPILPELKLQAPKSEEPHNSHGSLRAGLGVFQNHELQKELEPSLRFALHDLNDPAVGYPGNAKIEFLNLQFRAREISKDFVLKKMALFSIDSLTSWNEFESPLSWRGTLGAERLNDPRCDDCLSAVAKGATGLTWQWNSATSSFLLAGADAHLSSLFPGDKQSVSLGPILGTRWAPHPRFIGLIEAGWEKVLHSDGFEHWRSEATLRWAPKLDWALNLSGRYSSLGKNELGFTLYLYR